MTITNRTDPAAAHRAEHHIQDLIEDQISGGELHVEHAAVKVVDSFTAHFEYRDGLRRVVLTGEWEVDPADVLTRQVAGASAA